MMNNPSANPQNLLGGLGVYRPKPTLPTTFPASRSPTAPPEPEPFITVSKTGAGFWTLSKAMMRKAGVKPGDYVRLVPPRAGAAGKRKWYLETKPRPGDGQPIPANGFMRAPRLASQDFQRPVPQLADRPAGKSGMATVTNRNVPVPVLHFRLGAEVAGHPGYYELERASQGRFRSGASSGSGGVEEK